MLENYFSSLKDSNKLKGGMYQNSILTGYSNVLYSLFYILSYWLILRITAYQSGWSRFGNYSERWKISLATSLCVKCWVTCSRLFETARRWRRSTRFHMIRLKMITYNFQIKMWHFIVIIVSIHHSTARIEEVCSKDSDFCEQQPSSNKGELIQLMYTVHSSWVSIWDSSKLLFGSSLTCHDIIFLSSLVRIRLGLLH